ncbi:hypothetical protein IVB12_15530 [Bradyrhizobium sp. 179]|uniref:hypothetical protein n=1 Tax=Bradyrhizobium sp. 179 TaxID=2782648 RepID=UPI001FF809E1|nr:hypothetical protein [Bradyrhizobium sp. 179]MCK1543326.1 hypothetical protein [Bradyrhizobium sp. 179]
MKFKIGDWVRSVPVNYKGSFNGQIVDTINGDYVVRDAEKRRWLRSADELRLLEKETV